MDSASLLAEMKIQSHSQQTSAVSPPREFSADVQCNVSSKELANALKAADHITDAAKMLEKINSKGVVDIYESAILIRIFMERVTEDNTIIFRNQ